MRMTLSVSLLILLCLIREVRAADFPSGLALRENVLITRLPFAARTPSAAAPDRTFGISETALRVWTGVTSETVSLDAAIEFRGTFTSSSATVGGLGTFFAPGDVLERWNWTRVHSRSESTFLRTRVERLRLTVKAGPLDIDAGRQPVTLGTSHFVSVLDVIAPFAPGSLDATYKPGVDALRIRTGIGESGAAEVIGVGSRPWGNGALLGMIRTSPRGLDTVLLGGRFRERGFGGFAWDGEIAPVGIWGELAAFERKPAREHFYGGWSHRTAFSGIAGADITVPADIRTGFALMYQDFGVRHPEDLALVFADAPFREGWLFLGSSGYGMLTLHRQMHPLAVADLAGLVNLVDSSTLWQPRLTFSVSNNSDLSLYGWLGTGGKPRNEGTASIPRSEFGMVPRGAGVYARWFY